MGQSGRSYVARVGGHARASGAANTWWTGCGRDSDQSPSCSRRRRGCLAGASSYRMRHLPSKGKTLCAAFPWSVGRHWLSKCGEVAMDPTMGALKNSNLVVPSAHTLYVVLTCWNVSVGKMEWRTTKRFLIPTPVRGALNGHLGPLRPLTTGNDYGIQMIQYGAVARIPQNWQPCADVGRTVRRTSTSAGRLPVRFRAVALWQFEHQRSSDLVA